MGTRRQAREAACQMLYQMDVRHEWQDQHIAPFWHLLEELPSRDGRKYAEAIVRGILDERERLDKLVAETSKNWSIERMAAIDRNILRAAAWEMTGPSKLAPGIVIDEWVEIAKKFGTDQSPAFINGILDQVAKKVPR